MCLLTCAYVRTHPIFVFVRRWTLTYCFTFLPVFVQQHSCDRHGGRDSPAQKSWAVRSSLLLSTSSVLWYLFYFSRHSLLHSYFSFLHRHFVLPYFFFSFYLTPHYSSYIFYLFSFMFPSYHSAVLYSHSPAFKNFFLDSPLLACQLFLFASFILSPLRLSCIFFLHFQVWLLSLVFHFLFFFLGTSA